jgi:hypothetical protein
MDAPISYDNERLGSAPHPTGPAKALLKIVASNPKAIETLHDQF